MQAVDTLDLLLQRSSYVSVSLFYRVLKTCTLQKQLILGRRVHALATRNKYDTDPFLANHIVCLYASHGMLEEASQVFNKLLKPDVYVWSSIILAHVRCGQPTQAIELYRRMRESSLKPDSRIFVAALTACSTAMDLASGKEVHADLLGSTVSPGDVFLGSCLVDMYAKCGSLQDAQRVFEKLSAKNVVTWNCMIAGYAQCGLGQEALDLYATMQMQSVTPSHFTFCCLIKACTVVGALHQGEQIHAQVRRRDLDANVVVGSCLVDMYAKCGSLKEATKVFDKLQTRNVVSWNALLNGYAQNGDCQKAMKAFEEMVHEGVKPDNTTFNCLLVACSNYGLVDEGRQYFQSMLADHGIVPDVYNYTCLVDLLARSGRLEEAENLLQNMPFQSDGAGWRCLLSACRSYYDLERGRRCFDRIVSLKAEDTAAYVLLETLHANAGKWGDVEKLQSSRKLAGAMKMPARAFIEVDDRVETFIVGSERTDISSKLKSLNIQLGTWGYVPHDEVILKPISEQEKEDALCGHAEKLALAYGLLNTPNGTTLLVTKNLRMCDDCHSGTKILSALEKREIIVRDAHRVHRFQNGSCSCGDRY